MAFGLSGSPSCTTEARSPNPGIFGWQEVMSELNTGASLGSSLSAHVAATSLEEVGTSLSVAGGFSASTGLSSVSDVGTPFLLGEICAICSASNPAGNFGTPFVQEDSVASKPDGVTIAEAIVGLTALWLASFWMSSQRGETTTSQPDGKTWSKLDASALSSLQGDDVTSKLDGSFESDWENDNGFFDWLELVVDSADWLESVVASSACDTWSAQAVDSRTSDSAICQLRTCEKNDKLVNFWETNCQTKRQFQHQSQLKKTLFFSSFQI